MFFRLLKGEPVLFLIGHVRVGFFVVGPPSLLIEQYHTRNGKFPRGKRIFEWKSARVVAPHAGPNINKPNMTETDTDRIHTFFLNISTIL